MCIRDRERTMRNVSHILEKQLTDYLVTDQARFYRLAYSYLKNREEALDAVQTAVCRALEKQGELKEPEALRAWFYHILVHVCMDVLRLSLIHIWNCENSQIFHSVSVTSYRGRTR